MFLGTFVHTLDSKGRLTIPAKFRAALDEGLVVTRGIDDCLVGFPKWRWDKLAAQVGDLPLTDRGARSFKRFLFASAADVTPDSQGRILIPPRLREYAGLDGEVVIAGVNDSIEIWSTAAWHEERDRADDENIDREGWEALAI